MVCRAPEPLALAERGLETESAVGLHILKGHRSCAEQCPDYTYLLDTALS